MRAARMLLAISALAVSLLAAAAAGAGLQAAAAAPPLGAFRFTIDVPVAGPPEAVFDEIVGDVTSWWDHPLSQHPAKLEIEPRLGGTFRESFDAAGNGCEHARVTLYDRGRTLRLDGPLGLGGNATVMVSTLEFLPGDPGQTTLRLTCEGSGHVEPGWGARVEAAWRHLLAEQFKPHYEGGANR